MKDSLFYIDDSYVENLHRLGWDDKSAQTLSAWDWPHGIGLFGLWKQYDYTKNEQILADLISWYDSRLKIGLPPRNVNTVAPFLAMAFVYEKKQNDEWKKVMVDLASWIMDEMPRTPEGGIQHKHAELENHGDLWDDTLFMTCLFLAKAGKLFERQDWVDEAVYQALLHMKYLVDTKTGLWYHAWSFDNKDNYAEALWGRGNCWITVFIPELIDIVKPCAPVKRMLVNALEAQIDSLIQYQDPSGLWHTLITDPESYLESSATAGYSACILKAVRISYIKKECLKAAEKGLNALYGEIDEDGTVQHVSYGTNVGRDLDHYRNIPIRPMQYGQGLSMIAIIEGNEALKEGK
ncbi:MAG: glycoside hydrolase family 88 protein [Spirochaetales bacterium]|nr:glycoside hydrolase family 88 protein [Candidatus Physcosoma equi]